MKGTEIQQREQEFNGRKINAMTGTDIHSKNRKMSGKKKWTLISAEKNKFYL